MNSTCIKSVCACVVTFSVCVRSLHAEPIQYLEQARRVAASVRVHEPGEPVTEDFAEDDAIDFGIFDSSVVADVVFPLAFGHGDATQVSELAADRITAFGTANGVVTVQQGGFGEGGGASILDVTFILSEPSGFTLDGLISFFAVDPIFTGIGTNIELRGESSGIVFSEMLSADGVIALSDGGMLQPDTYTLKARVLAVIGGNSIHVARGSFDFVLVVPEPATALLLAVGGILMLSPRRR